MELHGREMALIYQSQAGSLWLIETRYWLIRINEGINLDEDESGEFLVAIAEYGKQKYPLVIERKYTYSVTLATYKMLRDCLPECVNALAVVTYSDIAFKTANYAAQNYLANMPTIPTLVTASMKQAMQWLKQQHLLAG